MAINSAALTNVLNQVFRGQLANQLNNRVPLLSRITKRLGSGKNIAWDVTVESNHNAGSYADGADITGDGATTDVPAILGWKYLKAEFKVTGPAMAQAASGGPEAFAKLLAKEVMGAGRDLAVQLATQIFGDGTGNAGKDIDGFAAALTNSGTYAGVSRATYPTWRATVLGNSGTPRALTKPLMDDAEEAVFTASGFAPDLIVTTPKIYKKFEQLFETILRHDPSNGDYRLGASQLSYKGIPIVRDQYCPAGTMYFFTFDSLAFEQLMPVSESDGMELVQGAEPLVMEDGSLGLQVAVELLGKSGDNYKGFVKLYGNLVVEYPNRNAVITDIDEA